MNTSSSRVLIACVWMTTVAGAYIVGRQGSAPEVTRGEAGPAKSGTRKVTDDSTAASDIVRASTVESRADRPAVKDIILQARAAMGTGMSGFMNIRGMFRALAPLADLSDPEIQEALIEVEKTVKEPQQKMMFYSMLLSQWAESDGPAALAYARDKVQAQGPLMASTTMSVIGTWARRDPEAVWRWYLDAREKGERSPMGGTEGYLSGIFNGMATASIDTALGRLGGLADVERQQALQGIAMSAMDPRVRESLLTRAPSMDAETRASIYQGMVGTWMMTDADGATKWMSTLPAEERKPLIATAGGTMMFMNPEKGAELQVQNASEKELPQTYARVVSQWAGRDPQAAGTWLNSQPQGPQLDDARRSFATSIAQRDPAGAFDWANAIQGDSKRMEAYQQVYQTLNAKNPANADAALEQAKLPPDIAQKVRESAKPKKVGEVTTQ